MKIRKSKSRKVFLFLDYTILTILGLTCLLPLIHILAMSLSSSGAVTRGEVGFWPVDFTLQSYKYVLNKKEFWTASLISVERVALGVAVNMILTVLAAYPLSREKWEFHGRSFYTWFFVITMLFSGGLIPTYLVVFNTGLINSIWSLILPGAVPIYNVILMMNFFRSTPKALEEAARMDGAGQFKVLWNIYIPLAKPSLATVLLFSFVGHWNDWFSGLLYMQKTENYPLQSYLRTIIIQQSLMSQNNAVDLKELANISDRTKNAAQIFIAMIPILIIYPLLQKHFAKGIIMGSVKE
ncbi:MAG: carbohydrate ABC transporter permease [Lachnospiraceae bacterium]|jgi:putative aldouronate transport system permease protein|nr:carbohydrate ABC transporter permease [Lachnospiraceae bacterium]